MNTLTFDIATALLRGELFLEYQPYWSLRDERVMGWEALVRWKLPTSETMTPAVFIPYAEESGFIAAIGSWVRTTAFNFAQQLPPHLRICVNVSGLEIDELLPVHLAGEIATSGIDPTRVVLEISENAATQATPAAIDALLSCADLGVTIAIDDFGAGYSSREYLQRLPAGIIKVDTEITAGIVEHAINRAVLAAAMEIADRNDGIVIAEGVETKMQCEWLKARGCDYAQGFLKSQPLSAEETLRLATSLVP